MTIEVSKQTIGAHRAIVWEFNQQWKWQDFLAALDSSNELIVDDPETFWSEQAETFCLVINIRHKLPTEQLAMANIRHAIKRFEGCDIIFVMEGAEMASNITINVFKEEFPELSEKIYIVHTLDDAYLHIDPFYTRPH